MTRHGKNSTAGSVYTYHERKKDTEQSGWGSQALRFGKDSVKEFDCCSLSLQPCKDAVVTPDGFLYDKQCILENILHQKREISRKLKEFERQNSKLEKETKELGQAEKASQMKKFLATSGVGTKKLGAEKDEASTSAAASISNTAGDKAKQLPSFWLPSLTPKASKSLAKKPDEKVRCPMSGRPLRLKDLTDVKFTPIKDDGKKSLITKDARFVCAISNDVLGNSVPAVVLKTSGNVVTAECYEKIIKKDMIDPTNGRKLREKDVIYIQRGASGFSAAGGTLEAKVDGPALMA